MFGFISGPQFCSTETVLPLHFQFQAHFFFLPECSDKDSQYYVEWECWRVNTLPDCRGKAFSLLLFCMMLVVGLLYNGLYYVYYVNVHFFYTLNVCQMIPLQLLR